jgi:hypothetical protein
METYWFIYLLISLEINWILLHLYSAGSCRQ